MWKVLLGAGAALAMHGWTSFRVRSTTTRQGRFTLSELTAELEGTRVQVETFDGASLHAVVSGPTDGPTVVLAHGYGLSSRSWNIVAPELVRLGYRVIAFDHRGHGKSNAGPARLSLAAMERDYLAVLEHFDIRDGLLVGHSLGGLLALGWTLTYPDVARARIRGLMLVAAGAGQLARGAPQYRMQGVLLKSGLLHLLSSRHPYKWLVGPMVFGEPYRDAVEAFNQDYWSQNQRRLLPVLQDLIEVDHYPRLCEVELPVTLLAGTRDNTIPRWHFDELGHRLPALDVRWIEGAGHMLGWEAPERVVEAVGELLPHADP